MELLMKYTALLLAVLLSGCSTAVPVTAKFPEPPSRLVTQRCPDLQKLNDDAKLSDISRTVTINYSSYYECAVKTDAWIEWYEIQKRIFEGAGK
jgi:PBP1b-binding outer membrane lipoprotein LpoB